MPTAAPSYGDGGGGGGGDEDDDEQADFLVTKDNFLVTKDAHLLRDNTLQRDLPTSVMTSTPLRGRDGGGRGGGGRVSTVTSAP